MALTCTNVPAGFAHEKMQVPLMFLHNTLPTPALLFRLNTLLLPGRQTHSFTHSNTRTHMYIYIHMYIYTTAQKPITVQKEIPKSFHLHSF